MTQQELIDGVEDTFAECIALIRTKNSDYAKDTSPFYNFIQGASIAGISVERHLLALAGMKLARIENLLDGNNAVHESLQDSMVDACNYIALLKTWINRDEIIEKVKAYVDDVVKDSPAKLAVEDKLMKIFGWNKK